jgi:tetratricopeptide (TPR) repeat protein
MANVEKLKDKARALETRGQWQQALELYRQAVDAARGTELEIGLWNRIGDLEHRLGHTERALEAYETAIDAYVDSELYNNAIALCNKVLRIVPGRAAIYLRLGKISAAQGFLADARKNYLEYADRMQRTGELDASFAALKDFASLSPEDTEIRSLLAEQLRSYGRDAEAVEQLQLLVGQLVTIGADEEAEQVRDRIRIIDPDADVSGRFEAPAARRSQPKDQDVDGGLDLLPTLSLDPIGDQPTLGSAGPGEDVDSVVDDLEDMGLVAGFEMHLGTEPVGSSGAADDAADDEDDAGAAFDLTIISGIDEDAPAGDVDRDEDEEGEPLPLIAFDGSVSSGADLEIRTGDAAEPMEQAGDDEDAEDDDEPLPLLDFSLDDDDLVVEGPPSRTLASVADEFDVLDASETAHYFEDVETDDAETAHYCADVETEDVETEDVETDDVETDDVETDDVETDASETEIADDAHPADGIEVDAPVEPATELEPEVDAAEDVEAEPEAEAEDEVDRLRRQFDQTPGDRAVRERLVQLLEERGMHDEVVSRLSAAQQELARVADYAGAAEIVEELLRRRPTETQLYQKRVEYAFRSGARHLLIPAYLGLAEHLRSGPTPDKATAVFQRVLNLDPGNEAARAALASPAQPAETSAEAPSEDGYVDLAALILGDDEEAETSTRFVVAEEAPSGNEDQDFSEMLSRFRQKVKENIATEDSSSHYDLGVAFKEMGLLDEAIAQFQVALQGGANPLATLESLGECFVEKGQFTLASRVLERALRLPGASEADLLGVYYLLARCEEANGQYERARELIERVLAVDIQFRDGVARLKALRSMVKGG